jgi:WD40 repeat protein
MVWEWQSETCVLRQQGHFYDMNVLAYSPDGQYIATGGDDGKVSALVSHSAQTNFNLLKSCLALY